MHLIAWEFQFTPTLALAIVALLGYVVGRRARGPESPAIAQARQEIRRAQHVIRELEKTAQAVRAQVASHESALNRFKSRLDKLRSQPGSDWQEFTREADKLLQPTLVLSTQISRAHDEIRAQAAQLMSFTDARTDPLTGVSNRRALDEALGHLCALAFRYRTVFSVVMLDIDHFKRINDQNGHLEGDRVLQAVSRILDEAARETDIVARYGGEEFVLLLEQTDITGACLLAERLRATIAERAGVTLSFGVVQHQGGEAPPEIVARADMALYAAKNSGRNRVYLHNGQAVERYQAAAVVGG